MGEAIGALLGKLSNLKAAAGFVLNVLLPLAPASKWETGIVTLLSLRLSPESFSFLVHKHGDVTPIEDSEQKTDRGALMLPKESLPASQSASSLQGCSAVYSISK